MIFRSASTRVNLVLSSSYGVAPINDGFESQEKFDNLGCNKQGRLEKYRMVYTEIKLSMG